MIDKKNYKDFELATLNAVVDTFDDTGMIEPVRAYKEMKPYDQKIHDDSVDNATNLFMRDSFRETRGSLRTQLDSFLRKEYNITDDRDLGITEEVIDELLLSIHGEADG